LVTDKDKLQKNSADMVQLLESKLQDLEDFAQTDKNEDATKKLQTFDLDSAKEAASQAIDAAKDATSKACKAKLDNYQDLKELVATCLATVATQTGVISSFLKVGNGTKDVS
jgi:Mg2+ and Co2+ transporter CorA